MPPVYDYNRAVQIFQEARRNAALAVLDDSNDEEEDDTTKDLDHMVVVNETDITTTTITTTTPNDIITNTTKHRLKYLQCAVETMEQLSTYCPLTPLLWIQYGRTMYEYYIECCRNSNSSNNTTSSSNNKNTTTTIEIAALQLEYETLRLGWYEFPGAALLQFRIIVVQVDILLQQQQVLLQCNRSQPPPSTNTNPTTNQLQLLVVVLDSIRTTLQQIGCGSHRNEDDIIVLFYRLQMTLLHCQQQQWQNPNNTTPPTITPELRTSIRQRSQCPMRTRNQNLMDEIQTILQPPSTPLIDDQQPQQQQQQQILREVEYCRQYEARTFQPLIYYENALEQSLYEKDHIPLPRFLPHFIRDDNNNNDNTTISSSSLSDNEEWFRTTIQSLCHHHVHWDVLFRLDPTSHTWGMGLGSMATAQIVIQYVKAMKQQVRSKVVVADERNHEEKDPPPDTMVIPPVDIDRLILSVYERGISECPCIEVLWWSYIRELQSWMTQQQYHHNTATLTTTAIPEPRRRQQLAMEQLSTVTQRAVRNCPYSISIVQQQFESVLLLATCCRRDQTSTDSSATTTQIRSNHLLTLLQDVLDLGFLPLTNLVDIMKVFLLPIQIMKRHIMTLLSEQHPKMHPTKEKSVKAKGKPSTTTTTTTVLYYDDSEPINTSMTTKTNPSKQPNLADNINKLDDDDDDDIMDEIEGSVEDLHDMYGIIEKKIHAYMMKQNQSEATKSLLTTTATEVCAMLHQEHAQSELFLLHPLRTILFDEDDDNEDDDHNNNNNNNNGPTTDIANHSNPSLQYLEKCIRCHNPPHPDSYIMYIQSFIYHRLLYRNAASSTTKPYDVLCQIRQIRGLYMKAIGAVGRGSKSTTLTIGEHHNTNVRDKTLTDVRDYESSLQRLCQDWLNFERIVGSPRSYGKASIVIEKKIQKMKSAAKTISKPQHTNKTTTSNIQNDTVDPVITPGQQQELSTSMDDYHPSTTIVLSNVDDTKRKYATIATDNDNQTVVMSQSTAKKSKTDGIVSITSLQDIEMDNNIDIQINQPSEPTPRHDDTNDAASNRMVINDSTSVEVPPKVPTVRVGNMDYPVHPYTIRVSNLSPDAEDMDLVDTFRSLCGTIVHARIVRDKHTDGNSKGVSKGYGLIQFEQLESVEKALTLDDTLGIHEKLVKVERSHLPAVSLVPPGMHRVRPKGEGKVSKRNQKRSQLRNHNTVSSDSAKVKVSSSTTNHSNDDPIPVVPDRNNDTDPKQDEKPAPIVAAMPEIKMEPGTKPSSTSVTAFRPRTVRRGMQHPKPRLKF